MHCIVFAPPDTVGEVIVMVLIKIMNEDKLTDSLTVCNPEEIFRVLIHVSVIKMATKHYIYFQILNLISLSY